MRRHDAQTGMGALDLVRMTLTASASLWAVISVLLVLAVGVRPEEAWRWGLLAALLALGLMRLIHAYVNAVLEHLWGVDLDASGAIGDVQAEQIRLVPYRGPARLIDGVPEQDLREFIGQLPVRGHTKRAWVGYRFKSGRVCDYETWKRLTDILAKAGLLQGRSERSAGVLVTMDPEEIATVLGL